MATLGDYIDIDKQIVASLDPPQVLSMSEVNKYFNQLTTDRRTEFLKVKFNLDDSLEAKYEWIVQWHIKCMSNMIKQLTVKRWKSWNLKKGFFNDFIGSSFHHNNFALAGFLLDIVKNRKSNILHTLSEFTMCIFEKDFDMQFVKYIDELFQTNSFNSLNILMTSIRISRTELKRISRIIINLLNKKQYDGVLYFLSLFENNNQVIDFVGNAFHKYIWDKNCLLILRECPVDFKESFFKILEMSDERVDCYHLGQACLAETDALFFEMISNQKYYYCIDYYCMFTLACAYGHLSILKWISADNERKSQIKLQIDCQMGIGGNYFTPFEWACYYGHIEIVKWLVHLESYCKPDIHHCNETPFFIACCRGHLNVAKYLIELGETTSYGHIDIHAGYRNYEVAYLQSIIRTIIGDQYEVAEWLFTLSMGLYGKFDLRKEILQIQKNISKHIGDDVTSKLQLIHDRMYELTVKYYGSIDVDDTTLSEDLDDSYTVSESDSDSF